MNPNTSEPNATSPDMSVNAEGGMEEAAPGATPVIKDVTPPHSVMDVTPPPADPVIGEAAAAAPPETPPLTSAEEPVLATEPENSIEATPAEVPAEAPVSVPATAEQPLITPTGADPAPAAAKAKKSGKGLVIIIAVVLALVVAGIAVAFYLKSKDDKKTTAAKTNQSQSVVKPVATAAKTITSSDIDAASKNVDTSLSGVDDSKDFNADSLSDKSLGLQ